jgi:hypothetical protein
MAILELLLVKVGDKIRIRDDADGSGSMARGKTGKVVDLHKNVVFVTLDDGATPEMKGLPPHSVYGDNILDLYEDEWDKLP